MYETNNKHEGKQELVDRAQDRSREYSSMGCFSDKDYVDPKTKQLAHEYAQAVWQVYPDQEQRKALSQDLNKLLTVLEDKEIAFWLCGVAGNFARNTEIVYDRLNLGTQARLLLQVIEKNGNKFELKSILHELVEKYDSQYCHIEAVLVTASACSEELLRATEEQLSRLKDKQVRVTNKVNPKHIGGAVLLIGDELIDMSYTNSLKQLEKTLYANIFAANDF